MFARRLVCRGNRHTHTHTHTHTTGIHTTLLCQVAPGGSPLPHEVLCWNLPCDPFNPSTSELCWCLPGNTASKLVNIVGNYQRHTTHELMLHGSLYCRSTHLRTTTQIECPHNCVHRRCHLYRAELGFSSGGHSLLVCYAQCTSQEYTPILSARMSQPVHGYEP